MLKKGKCKRFNHFQCPRCYVLILRDTHFDFPPFFPLMWKDLRELPLAYHYLDYHLYSSLFVSKKNENRQNKKKQSNNREFVVTKCIRLLRIYYSINPWSPC